MRSLKIKATRAVKSHDGALRVIGLFITWVILVFVLYGSLQSFDPSDVLEQRGEDEHVVKHYRENAGNIHGTGQLQEDSSHGSRGKAVKLTVKESKLSEETYSLNEFSLVASDKIGYFRTIPDLRQEKCKEKIYPTQLPTVSIIVIFHNEALSTLLRTVTSCYEKTRRELLREIILVDDFSDRAHLKEPLEEQVIHNFTNKVKIIRTPTRQGLIKARIYGSNFANGDVLMFLDSHCECAEGWAEPVLYEILKDNKTAVQPNIASIDRNNFRFSANAYSSAQGNFQWDLLFHWRSIPHHDEKLRHSSADAVRTPTMAGGLFGISRWWWNYLGKYDPGFELWGGENIEISVKSWLCGGSVVITPCSIIGHVFRSKHPYQWYKAGPDNAFSANARRLAEVWLDEYKIFFYKQAPEQILEVDMGDISDRLELKKRLNCRPFKWFLENVVRNIHVPTLETILEGSLAHVSDPANPQCIDTYSKNSGEVHVYPCHYRMTQKFDYTAAHELRILADICLEVVSAGLSVEMKTCYGRSEQRWTVDQAKLRIIHQDTGQCLTLLQLPDEEQGESKVVINDCIEDYSSANSQMWKLKKNAAD